MQVMEMLMLLLLLMMMMMINYKDDVSTGFD